MEGLLGHHIKEVKTIDGREVPELRDNTGIKSLREIFVICTIKLQEERNFLWCSQKCLTG